MFESADPENRQANDSDSGPRQRIIDAAVRLFARRGYAAVGIREIAAAASVNVARISYYFGSKPGLLRAVAQLAYDRHSAAQGEALDVAALPAARLVREIVAGTVEHYRRNLELARVLEETINADEPEVHELYVKLMLARRRSLEGFWRRLGLDTSDPVALTVMRGMVASIVSAHFNSRYAVKNLARVPGSIKREELALLRGSSTMPEDRFYARYSDLLTEFYLGGVRALARRMRVEPKTARTARPKSVPAPGKRRTR